MNAIPAPAKVILELEPNWITTSSQPLVFAMSNMSSKDESS